MFMNRDEPNFIWKNRNAVRDMGCIIEKELLDIAPNKRYEHYSIIGRNGELTETFHDYEAFDYEIKNVTIPYEDLSEVKRWLSGKGKLITHNDEDKYWDAICTLQEPLTFENEWGVFYTFNITFRCQPFKRKVNEAPKVITTNKIEIYDHGDEIAYPYVEIDSSGGDIRLTIGDRTLTILRTQTGVVTVDNEKGKVMQEGLPLFTRGDWLRTQPGKNILNIVGNVKGIKFWNRSAYL